MTPHGPPVSSSPSSATDPATAHEDRPSSPRIPAEESA
ncbi:hypothetical protein STRIP9103_09400 [Streptomyces ipomoeae 91-03]|uniref:Uncharacterized protein n=1 Tax=Streptomyces ipomoeae 91-03 TaxID=698759 RepID=L1L7R2_9ACTN|nr:hypothetical protein STRIP9103_09400 [Streptomyces ipomoeae 91-03]